MTKQELREKRRKFERIATDVVKEIDALKKQENQIDLNKNRTYIGKTYKKETNGSVKYFKIMGVDEENIFRMPTFVLTLPVMVNSIGSQAYLSNSLKIESVGWFCSYMEFKHSELDNSDNRYPKAIPPIESSGVEIDRYTEVTETEFQDALDKYSRQIKELLNEIEV